jgi:hypothetical protein
VPINTPINTEPAPFKLLTLEDHKARYAELIKERTYKLDTLKRSLDQSIHKGYDFASPNANLFMLIVQIEAQIRELRCVCYGV